MSRVRKIKPVCIASKPLQKPSKNKVAAYARVSTYNDEQLNSLEAQKDYYEKKIRENPSWMFAGIYVDEGITGTSYAHRAEFLRMIEDCKNGKIDMVLTKSVSRFARNTVDALNVIRELKEIGVGVYFERENVWTLDSKGEFLITLLTSLAQEEARSISENTAWGIRKRFADGQYAVGYKHFLGYNAGFEVNKEQAVFVRLIFRMYIQGYSTCRIAKILQEWEIKSPANGDRWHPSSVISILKNEKYKGDALLQKSFTVDFLTKKAKKNEGELQQYYVHEGHEAIIDAMAFDYTQTLITTRYLSGREKYSGITPAYRDMPTGTRGTVDSVDDTGTIHVAWDNGCHLGVVYGEDSCRKLHTIKTICYGKEETWDCKEDAVAFFLQAVAGSEGAECERYKRILADLAMGMDICTNEE